MVEVVFGDSTAGAMVFAMMGYVERDIIPFFKEDEPKSPENEIEKIRQEAKIREKRNWGNAIPLEGSRGDIFSFNLALSVGEIDEEGIGSKRKAALDYLSPTGFDYSEKIIEDSQKKLSDLMERAKQGEPIRVWSSDNPDEACGLYWLMEQLRPLGFENLDITLVKLPEFQERPDGSVVQYTGWGEVEDYQFGRLALSGEKLPVNGIRMLADRWKELQKDNSPLRAVLNGQLVSVSESLYDSYILREIRLQEREFNEAVVIGNVIGKYQLGIGDSLIAKRVEKFIHDGLVEAVTQTDENDPSYRRILRKCL